MGERDAPGKALEDIQFFCSRNSKNARVDTLGQRSGSRKLARACHKRGSIGWQCWRRCEPLDLAFEHAASAVKRERQDRCAASVENKTSSAGVAYQATRDPYNMLALIAAHFQFQCRWHAQLTPSSGNTTCPVGRATSDLTHRCQILKRIG